MNPKPGSSSLGRPKGADASHGEARCVSQILDLTSASFLFCKFYQGLYNRCMDNAETKKHLQKSGSGFNWRSVLFVLIAGLVLYILVPQLLGIREALFMLEKANKFWLILAIGIEFLFLFWHGSSFVGGA